MRRSCFLVRLAAVRSICAAALGVFVATCPWCGASQARGSEPRLILGVGTHLQGGGSELVSSLDRLSKVGAVSLRDDAPWARVEQQRGQLRIPRDWDRLVNGANARGIEPLMILDYGNKFYSHGARPTAPSTVAAFARYASLVAEHFKGRVKYYEIWNEWNNGAGDIRGGNTASYFRLAVSTYRAVKDADPDATVLGGAVTPAGIRGGFLPQLVRLGLLDHVDALSLHTYIHCRHAHDPEDWAAWMEDVEDKLKRLAGKPVPFYITEIGWPSYAGACGVSLNEQGRFLARMFLLARTLPFIKGIWWYDLRNDGTDPENREDNFGLLYHDMLPKPAYAVLKAIGQLVREGRYMGKLNTGKRGVEVLRFLQADVPILAMWKQSDVGCAKIQFTSPTPIEAQFENLSPPISRGIRLASREKKAHAYALTLTLSRMPRLLSLSNASGNPDQFSVNCVAQ